jgi:hypothetical protein
MISDSRNHLGNKIEEIMYTVIRFRGVRDAETMAILGQMADAAIGDTIYHGPDHSSDRFSLSVSSASDWHSSQIDILSTIHRLKDVIVHSQTLGIAINIDVAIEPEDYWSRWVTALHVDCMFMQALSEKNIELVVSMYGNGPEDVSVSRTSTTRDG